MAPKSCPTRVKTAATPAGAQRPRFRERQVLRAADLEAEQSYLIAARRRHHIGSHGWGIVQGLEIVDTPELVVQPGIAIDGYGRELIVSAPVQIPSDAFTELADDALDVWLLYTVEAADVPQRGSYSCGPGRNSRTRQRTRLRLTPAPKNDQRLPIEVPRSSFEVPSEDVPFLPDRMPPDDPAREWPVYLGTIKQKGPAHDPKSPRPYATLNGEMVTAPSGRARMQVGSELKSDTRRFAVSTPDASGKFTERLSIDRDGNTFIRNNTTVTRAVNDPTKNRVHLRADKKGMVNLRSPRTTPGAASPWQIYRTSVGQAKSTLQQLRVEIGHPGDKGDPKQFQFAVGTRNGATFVPCFSLSADCTLTIQGDVHVKQLVEGPIEPNAADPRFTSMLAVQWLKGTNVGVKTATTGTIQGTVWDEHEAAIPLSTVKLKNLDTTFEQTLTDLVKGHFAAPDIPIGKYEITAGAPGFVTQTITSTLAASQNMEKIFTLQKTPPTGTFSGTLRDVNGALIPGGDVELNNLDVTFNEHVKSDTAGTFVAPNLPVGRYDITVNAPGFQTAVIHKSLGPGDVTDIAITLQVLTPGRIEGTVVDASGATVPTANVAITNTDTNTTTKVAADTQGQFVAPNLAPGHYSIKVDVSTSVPELHTLSPGQTLNITLTA